MIERRDATVLLVDDEPNLVDLYERFLSPAYDVYTATSGVQALETIDESFDVSAYKHVRPGVTNSTSGMHGGYPQAANYSKTVRNEVLDIERPSCKWSHRNPSRLDLELHSRALGVLFECLSQP